MGKFPRIIPTLIQIRAHTYETMLKSLRPESRLLLGQAVGDFAVSAEPDLEAVAEQLEIALTTEEKQAIIDEVTHSEEQVSQAMEALKRSVIQSGLAHAFGPPTQWMDTESPGMTLVSLSIEELMFNLNRYKQRDEDDNGR
jgi:hypothetical protein